MAEALSLFHWRYQHLQSTTLGAKGLSYVVHVLQYGYMYNLIGLTKRSTNEVPEYM